MSEEKKLTTKQQLFISEYLIDFNATRAAKAAGYSEDTANVIGCENLTKPNIKVEIEKQVNNMMEASRDRLKNKIREHLEAIAFGVGDDIPIGEQRRALSDLAKYMNLMTDRIEHTTIDENGEPTGFNVKFE